MKALKVLMTLRAWKSKTVGFGAVLALLPVIDATFFNESDLGGKILDGFMWLVNLQPIWPVDEAGAVKALVFLIGGAVVWLRTITSKPLDQK